MLKIPFYPSYDWTGSVVNVFLFLWVLFVTSEKLNPSWLCVSLILDSGSIFYCQHTTRYTRYSLLLLSSPLQHKLCTNETWGIQDKEGNDLFSIYEYYTTAGVSGIVIAACCIIVWIISNNKDLTKSRETNKHTEEPCNGCPEQYKPFINWPRRNWLSLAAMLCQYQGSLQKNDFLKKWTFFIWIFLFTGNGLKIHLNAKFNRFLDHPCLCHPVVTF